jgi:hypothetical protein
MIVKHGDEGGQSWDPRVTAHPIMPETMVPFYESYIPFKCAGFPDRAKAAFEALARRDQRAVEYAMDGEVAPPIDMAKALRRY